MSATRPLALVTGVSSGIGLELARPFNERELKDTSVTLQGAANSVPPDKVKAASPRRMGEPDAG